MKAMGLAVAAILLGCIMVFGAIAAGAGAPAKKGKKSAGASTSKTSVAAGKKVLDANGCAGCHAIAGKGGKMGPDLSHIGKTHKAAALAQYVRNPKKSNPKAKMPAYDAKKIDAKQLNALAAYLGSLK